MQRLGRALSVKRSLRENLANSEFFHPEKPARYHLSPSSGRNKTKTVPQPGCPWLLRTRNSP
jgi:hypothetical protein